MKENFHCHKFALSFMPINSKLPRQSILIDLRFFLNHRLEYMKIIFETTNLLHLKSTTTLITNSDILFIIYKVFYILSDNNY